jgi:serine/threonine protein kinase
MEPPKKGNSLLLENALEGVLKENEEEKGLVFKYIDANINKKTKPWSDKLLQCIRTIKKTNRGITASKLFSHGAYKCVFDIDGSACAFEICNKQQIKRRRYTYTRLKSILDCHLNVPDDYHEIELVNDWYIFLTKMKFCPQGDLFHVFVENGNNNLHRKDYLMTLIQPLALTLNSLHKQNMYIIDIKIENVLLCDCNGYVFTFIDLDDIVFGSEKDVDMATTPGYSLQIILVKKQDNNGYTLGIGNKKDTNTEPLIPGGKNDIKALEWLDWNAFCNMAIMITTWGLYNSIIFIPESTFIQKNRIIKYLILNAPDGDHKNLNPAYEKNKKYITPFIKACCEFITMRAGYDFKFNGVLYDVSAPYDETYRDESIQMLLDVLIGSSENLTNLFSTLKLKF